MKHTVLSFIGFVLLCLNSSAQQKLEAFFTQSAYYSPESGPYVETYLTFNGSTLKYKSIGESQYQGSVEITYIFYKDGEIDSFKKYNVLSPVISDTIHGLIDFVDFQRLPVKNGEYEFEILLRDLNKEMEPFSGKQNINIQFLADSIRLSDVTLLKSYRNAKEGEFSKSGIHLTPYMTDFFPEVQSKLSYYTELYHTDIILGENIPLLVKSYIKEYSTDKVLNSWTKYKKYTSGKVIPILNEFNIEKLPSGNYQLVIEVVDRENQLLDQKVIFLQRSNPKLEYSQAELSLNNNFKDEIMRINSRDTLLEYVKCVKPISLGQEAVFIDQNYQSYDLGSLKSFFIEFWTQRNPVAPGEEWVKYKRKIDFVNKRYATMLKRGYETDRGATYLKYGLPNQITDRANEPSSYPYIIWHYYNHPKRTNAKYVFYNPDLITNDYQLLHSTVPGEINNYRWEFILQQRNTNQQSLDQETGNDHWGGRASDYFNNPR